MLNYVTMEHVHADVVGKLKLELKSFTGIEIPRLLHRFIGITRLSISTDTLLGDIMNVHCVHPSRRVRKDPFLSRPQHRPGIDPVRVKP